MKYLLIISSASLFILADTFSANWGKTGHIMSIVYMCVVGCAGYFLFGLLNQKLSLSVSGGMVNIMLVVGALLVSYFYFQEPLAARQFVGITLACVAIFLMS